MRDQRAIAFVDRAEGLVAGRGGEQLSGPPQSIFGSALFSIVVFRHLPELGRDTDILLAARRGVILVGCLFALFCTSLEAERLGQAFEGNRS